MLAPLSWLKDYVDIDVTPKELEEKLFSCGFEVEELIEVGKDISNVVVGLVESCEPTISHSATTSHSAMPRRSRNALFAAVSSCTSSPKKPNRIFQNLFCLFP